MKVSFQYDYLNCVALPFTELKEIAQRESYWVHYGFMEQSGGTIKQKQSEAAVQDPKQSNTKDVLLLCPVSP